MDQLNPSAGAHWRPIQSSDLEAEQVAIRAVIHAADHARAKWGIQRHAFSTWHLILSEEVGEVAQATLNHYSHPPGSDQALDGLLAMRLELAQVGGVVLSTIAHIDEVLTRPEYQR